MQLHWIRRMYVLGHMMEVFTPKQRLTDAVRVANMTQPYYMFHVNACSDDDRMSFQLLLLENDEQTDYTNAIHVRFVYFFENHKE